MAAQFIVQFQEFGRWTFFEAPEDILIDIDTFVYSRGYILSHIAVGISTLVLIRSIHQIVHLDVEI